MNFCIKTYFFWKNKFLIIKMAQKISLFVFLKVRIKKKHSNFRNSYK